MKRSLQQQMVDGARGAFIPYGNKNKLSKKEKEEKAVEDDIVHRREYVLYFQNMEKKREALINKRALVAKFKQLYLELEDNYSMTVLPAGAYTKEVEELVFHICNNALDMYIRTLLMHCLCSIYGKWVDRFAAQFEFPTAPRWIDDAKTFLLHWGGMLGTVEHDFTAWKNMFTQFSLIALAIADGEYWKITPRCGRFLYVQERVRVQEDILRETAGLINLLSSLDVTTPAPANTGTMTILQRAIQKERLWSEQEKKRAMQVVVQKEEEVHYDVTFATDVAYTWFTKVFSDMTHSTRIINTMRTAPWQRVSPDVSGMHVLPKFIAGMNLFVALFLKEFHQKDLLNELQELKFCNRAYVPGLSESSQNYADQVNLEIWRNMYMPEITALNDMLAKDDLDLVMFWNSLKAGELFAEWFRFFIARLVLQTSLYKFIPRFLFDVLDVHQLEQFQHPVSNGKEHFFIHYHYWGFMPLKLFAFGFNAPFELLLQALLLKHEAKPDPFIPHFIQTILYLADHPHERYPDYPTIGTVAAAQRAMPPNVVLFSEKQASQRIFK